jgi:hypothetical protein
MMAATVEGANTYFTKHLESAKWAVLTPEQKEAAIAMAQSDIDSLPLKKQLINNAVADVMPEDTKNAMIYEQALFLTVITSDRQNLQAQGVTSDSVSGVASETYRKLSFGIALAPRAKAKATGYWALGAVR